MTREDYKHNLQIAMIAHSLGKYNNLWRNSDGTVRTVTDRNFFRDLFVEEIKCDAEYFTAKEFGEEK
jgi:hypothetical protein